MADENAELTPEQKIEQKIFRSLEPAEPEPAEPAEPVEAEAEYVEVDETAEAEEAEEFAEDEAVAEDVPDGVEMFDVELDDGTIYEVPGPLRDAVMRNKDYTEKSQSLANDRKAIDVVRDSVTQAQQQQEFINENHEQIRRGDELDWQIAQLREYMRNNIDTLTGNDLEKVRFQIDEMNLEKDGLVQALRAKYSEFQQATEQARQELRAKSTDALKARLPNWGDDAEAQARKYGASIGFTDEELDASVDPREMQVLWEASEYRRLKAGAKPAARKAKAAPKIRPKGRDARPQEVRRKVSIRKRLDAETDPKKKARIIQEDMKQRLKL